MIAVCKDLEDPWLLRTVQAVFSCRPVPFHGRSSLSDGKDPRRSGIPRS